MVTGITDITHVTTKTDMSRWTRAHADAPGINWSVYPGPGGTMIIVEHEEDRCTLASSSVMAAATPEVSPDIVTAESVELAPADPAGVAGNMDATNFAASA